METTSNKYITVAYELYTFNDENKPELVEKVPVEHPFQFISGMDVTLDSFESKILELNEGDTFDFTLTGDEAYGSYELERVIELGKEVFSVDGHFDKERVYAGAVLPLINEDGNRFDGLVKEVKDNTVVVDLNHPLAGLSLHFKGKVVTMREATKEEIEGMANMLSGEGCGCEHCGGEDCEHGEHHCHGEGHHCHGGEHKKGEGCCGHHHHE